MKKPLLFIAFISLAASSAFAGGLLTNTNQSVHFLRNPARDASTEIDAVYTNPAGLTFLTDGLHLSFTNQSVYQTRTITSTFAPFAAYNDGNTTKTFNGEAAAPIVPSFQLAYKKDNYVISATAAITGGGGKAVFNHGLPSSEASISMLPTLYAGLGVTKYSVNSYMEGRQYIFGLQMNGSYKFCDSFSGALGFRLNVVNNGYIGHLNDIKFNPGGGDMTTASPNKNLDCTQTGWGVTPIVSLNYHLSGLNLSAKYEFRSALNVQNNTKVDDTGLYADGVNTPQDIPAYLALGAEYKICEKLKVSGGYHHFFDSDAKMAKDKQKYINGGINEFLLGTEVKLNDMFLLSAGGQITRTGVTDAYQSDMSYSLNSYSIGFGGAMNITPDLRLNVAYFFTNYSDWTKTTTPTTATNGYNGTPFAGTDVYARTNKVFGIGLDYKF
ncbi:MAG TPA: aromatic hydrocarbon degradation protein [Paludibacter sp.]